MTHRTIRRARLVVPAITCLALGVLAGCAEPDAQKTTQTSSQAGVTAGQTTPASGGSTQGTSAATPAQPGANSGQPKDSGPQNSTDQPKTGHKGGDQNKATRGGQLIALANCEDPKLTAALAPLTKDYSAAPEQNSASNEKALLCHWVNGTGKLIMVSINRNTKPFTAADATKRVNQDPDQTILVQDPRLASHVATASGAGVKNGQAESISVSFPGGSTSDQLLIQSIGATFDVNTLTGVVAALTSST